MTNHAFYSIDAFISYWRDEMPEKNLYLAVLHTSRGCARGGGRTAAPHSADLR